jgi:hypothetical protein
MNVDALTTTTLALEASQHRLGWGRPARLFGIDPAHTWVMVDEGEPYDLVELFTLFPGEEFVAIALVVEGWGTRPGHPRRERVRTTVAVHRDRTHVAVVRAYGGPAEVMPDGAGALMDRLLSIWDRLAAADN